MSFAIGRVVVGISGSLSNMLAIQTATHHARHWNVPLVLVHVWPFATTDLPDHGQPARAAFTARRDEALTVTLQAVVDAVGSIPSDITVRLHLPQGPVAAVLLAIADQADDLLVVGAGNKNTVNRWLSPSVSQLCARIAQCQVLVVPTPPLLRQYATGEWNTVELANED